MDANGGTLIVNNKELVGPNWEKPGANQFYTPTWETANNEIALTDEELFWSRKPATIELKKGWNSIMMRLPRNYKDQAWMAVFVPVKLDTNGRWVEDLSVVCELK